MSATRTMGSQRRVRRTQGHRAQMRRREHQTRPGLDTARFEVPGDRVQTVPSYQPPVQFRHHRRLGRFRFLSDQLPGLRIEHPLVPIGDTPTRPASYRIGRHRPPHPRRDLRGLILPIDRIFQQRTTVAPIGWIPATSPAAFLDHQYLRVKPIILQIRYQPREIVAGLAGVA